MKNTFPNHPTKLDSGLNGTQILFKDLGRLLKTPWARTALTYERHQPQVLQLVVGALELVSVKVPAKLERPAQRLLRTVVPSDCSLYHFCLEWCERIQQTSPDPHTYELRRMLLEDLFKRLRPICRAASERKRPPRNETLKHSCWSLTGGRLAPAQGSVSPRPLLQKR